MTQVGKIEQLMNHPVDGMCLFQYDGDIFLVAFDGCHMDLAGGHTQFNGAIPGGKT
ncbi:MAG: hypothetical protein ACR5LD_06190 [Symbiopectobacterium sp.]